jgi:hypothetical protein
MGFGIALECVMHAELHGNDIEGFGQLGLWDAMCQGLRIAVKYRKRGIKT